MTIKCAIYVRKSTEHELDQEFNSLDNQELSCKAYIASQAFNDWEYYKTYADGGISGGGFLLYHYFFLRDFGTCLLRLAMRKS